MEFLIQVCSSEPEHVYLDYALSRLSRSLSQSQFETQKYAETSTEKKKRKKKHCRRSETQHAATEFMGTACF